MMLQYCPKVLDLHFDEFPGFLGLFDEISLETKLQQIFGTPIVLIRANFRMIFRCARNIATKTFWRKCARLEIRCEFFF